MKRLIILGLLWSTVAVSAQDRLFTYTYQSTVLNKGQKEIEVWNTLRTGRDDFYARYDNRTEFEIGLGGKLQTAFYVNLTSKTSTMEENTSKYLNTENEISFSNEWKLKLTDPVVNPVGVALYGEYSIGSNEYELEGKLILDKKLHDFTFAMNTVYELEFKTSISENETEWEKENKVDLDLGIAYSFSPTFAITIENTWKNVIEHGEVEHSALYSGPGVSCVLDHFWVNFTALPQLVSFTGKTHNSRNLDEFEAVQFRLLFSYVF